MTARKWIRVCVFICLFVYLCVCMEKGVHKRGREWKAGDGNIPRWRNDRSVLLGRKEQKSVKFERAYLRCRDFGTRKFREREIVHAQSRSWYSDQSLRLIRKWTKIVLEQKIDTAFDTQTCNISYNITRSSAISGCFFFFIVCTYLCFSHWNEMKRNKKKKKIQRNEIVCDPPCFNSLFPHSSFITATKSPKQITGTNMPAERILPIEICLLSFSQLN